MHCGRVCEAILGRLGGVGWCCRGHRVGRWPAGPEAGWRRGLLRPSACRATRCATAVFPPACGAGLQNGRRWRAKRALRQPETGPVAWPGGGVAPGRRRAPLCRRPSGGAVATVCRRGGGHPVGPWPPCAGVAEAPERRFCNFFAGGCKFFPKKFWRFGKSDYLCTRLQEARALSSAGLEHLPYKQRVGGSNPSAPTTEDSAPHPGWQNLFLCPGKFYRLFFG